MAAGSETKAKGRPREFDVDRALDAATHVFWRKGYEGASLPDLTDAMGINRPSLYAAFGNKESLFRRVVDRYAERFGGFLGEALAEPSARGAIEAILKRIATHEQPGGVRGCLLVQGALACGDEAEPIRRELAEKRGSIECAVRVRLERAVAEGELSRKTDVGAVAKFVATFQHGLAVQSASGATREALLGAVGVAMRAVDAALVPKARRGGRGGTRAT